MKSTSRPHSEAEAASANMRRAIDLREGEKIDEAAFQQLIRAAVAANSAARAQASAKKRPAKKKYARFSGA